MREIERRLGRLENAGPAQQSKIFSISDCPEDDTSDDKQIRHSLDDGRVIYLLEEHVMSDEEWVERHCTPD